MGRSSPKLTNTRARAVSARPGTLTSGTVKFSDGQSAQWYLDQMGRFGMVPPVRGYRPSLEDLQEFQMLLDRELQKLGI